jgi:hypothetical protein
MGKQISLKRKEKPIEFGRGSARRISLKSRKQLTDSKQEEVVPVLNWQLATPSLGALVAIK